MTKLFAELKRRKVFRVAAVYAVVAWLLIQVADVVLPTFGAPAWVNQTLIFLFVIGFPLALVLAWAYEITADGVKSDSSTHPVQSSQPTSVQPINYLILAIVIVVAIFQVTDRFLIQPPQQAGDYNSTESIRNRTEWLNLILGDVGYAGSGFLPFPLEISPDGTSIAYASRLGSSRLFVRDFDEASPRLLEESDAGIIFPTFSPDGQRLLFEEATVGLRVISAFGGSSDLLTDNLDTSTGFDWIDENTVVYVGRERAIYTLSLEDRQSNQIVGANESLRANVQALPGTSSILFMENDSQSGPRVVSHDLDSGETSTLVNNAYAPTYVPSGHLLFARDNDLWGIAFDLDSHSTSGEPVPLVEGIQSSVVWNRMSYAISDTGRLAYRPEVADISPPRVFTWINENGNEEFVPLPADYYSAPRISPDNSKFAYLKGLETRDIWIYDSISGVSSRVTFNDEVILDLVWSPDGQFLYYGGISADGERGAGIWRINADGSGQPELILESALRVGPKSVSSDGRQVVYIEGAANNYEVRILTLGIESSNQLLIPHTNSEYEATLSPDQNWLAFTGRDFGPHAIFVHRFSDVQSGKWLVSERARQPVFSSDSRKVYFIDTFDTDSIQSVNVVSSSPFAVDSPTVIASDVFNEPGSPPSYDISRDSNRVLFLRENLNNDYASGNPRGDLVVVNNWFNVLNELIPTP